MERVRIEQLDERHIRELVALSARLGWDYAPPELQTLLGSGVAYGHRNEAGELITSAAIFPYGETLASIGVVMVHPEYRRLGLGRVITQQVIDAVPAQMPIMLVATAQGQPMYEVMGFRTVGTLHKFLGERYTSPSCELMLPDDYEVVPLREEHVADIIRLDADAVGGDRTHFLKRRVVQAAEGLVVKGADGEVVGYGLSVQGPKYRIIGPIVAPNTEVATVLVDRLAREHAGDLRIDVPSHHQELVATLTDCGLECVNIPPVMLLRGEELPRRNLNLYAVAAQAFG